MCVSPEVSRTFTYGQQGTSTGQFYSKYLGKIELAGTHIDWGSRDVHFLLKDNYDSKFQHEVDAATPVDLEAAISGGDGLGDAKVLYHDKQQFIAMCKRLGIMEDLKAGVPRTAYRGVVTIRSHGRRIFLSPSYTVEQDITVRHR